MEDLLKRCWAAISLDHLAYNMKQIRSRLHAGCRVMAVVKANAYGHGDAALVPYFQQYGADWFAVSNLEEALMLRRNGAALPLSLIHIFADFPARHIGAHRVVTVYAYQGQNGTGKFIVVKIPCIRYNVRRQPFRQLPSITHAGKFR